MALKITLCVFLAIVFLATETTSKSLNSTDSPINQPGLISSPAISGLARDILNGGRKLLEVVEELQDEAKKIYRQTINKTEEALIQLQQGVTKLDNEQKTFAAEAMGTLFEVKYTLKITRTTLNGVAQGLVGGMDELTVLAEAIFEGDITDEEEINTILNWNVVTAKNMIRDAQEIIDSAKKSYEDIGEKMAYIDKNLILYRQFVKVIVESEKSAAQKAKTDADIARGSIYGSCATSTIICIFVDIFGAFGACSAINAGTCATLIGSMESAIAVVKDNMEFLDTKAEIALDTVNEVLGKQKPLLEYFQKELNALNVLDSALTYTGQNVDRSKDLFFINIPRLRTHYLESLAKLKQAAQDYLDQPELDN